jgi:hypothetical protein
MIYNDEDDEDFYEYVKFFYYDNASSINYFVSDIMIYTLHSSNMGLWSETTHKDRPHYQRHL